jgi:hypothetical protein
MARSIMTRAAAFARSTERGKARTTANAAANVFIGISLIRIIHRRK